ncbi:MAG: hypothetical protein FWH29_09345 [Methanobrevibacter sp.]|nr:hypothetical protein [Methanobrevibacter sp.]
MDFFKPTGNKENRLKRKNAVNQAKFNDNQKELIKIAKKSDYWILV